jgi:exodeoxyribonuclease V alpha subunit
VDAGSVFGDLCQALDGSASEEVRRARVALSKSWRFKEDDPVGILSRLVKEGKGEEVVTWLGSQAADGRVQRWAGEDPGGLAQRLRERWRALWECSGPEDALAFLGTMLVLVATNRGPWGREEINRAIHGGSERHRPVIITENDAALGLWNGDLGVEMAGKDGVRWAWFPGKTPSDPPRSFLSTILPPHQTAYAITIHKSQGSEAREVVCILRGSERMLSRQLFYTGITRARERLVIVASDEEIRAAVDRPVQRASDIGGKLLRTVPS